MGCPKLLRPPLSHLTEGKIDGGGHDSHDFDAGKDGGHRAGGCSPSFPRTALGQLAWPRPDPALLTNDW